LTAGVGAAAVPPSMLYTASVHLSAKTSMTP
jgi:hypothetical protein